LFWKQELQRDIWELSKKLQHSEDARSAAEERALCAESFAQHSLNMIVQVGLAHGPAILCSSAEVF
jgi:hypothetical protein